MAVKALRVGVGAWRIGVDVGARNAAARKLQRNRRNQIGVMLGPMHSRRDHAISEIRRRKRIGNLGSDLEIVVGDVVIRAGSGVDEGRLTCAIRAAQAAAS